jgi:circadian clock protein KaiC
VATGILKSSTGIAGLDAITYGGFPSGRPTLVCGGPGSGKTLLAMEFLVRGATQFGEPGVFVSFEETERELTESLVSLGFDLNVLVESKQLALDYVRVERHEIEETGEYDLEGLFIRLDHAIRGIGAKRLVLDTIEALFGGLRDQAILRAELRRLFRWLKDHGITTIVTAERGEGQLTRQGLEEYVSDCVVLLDQRVTQQISTRRLRIVKYRGSSHGTNEYPFLIGRDGMSVLPITSLGLNHAVSTQRVSSGIDALDRMLGGGGFYAGSTILVSGTAGTGKSILAATFADATCRRGARCLYFAFEESERQIVRNMASVGLTLDPWIKNGSLAFSAARPSLYGIEMHLAHVHRQVEQVSPDVVILDPLTSLGTAGSIDEVTALMMRLIDFLKVRQITAMLTSLSESSTPLVGTVVGVSSLTDTWIALQDVVVGAARARGLSIIKSRGMAHSAETRGFRITDEGVRIMDEGDPELASTLMSHAQQGMD